jgi:hypothetical protein
LLHDEKNGESMRRATSRAGRSRRIKSDVKRKTTAAHALTPKQKRELTALAALTDEQIDTSDISELPPGAWKDAVRGKFYRPLRRA